MPEILATVVAVGPVADANGDALDPGGGVAGVATDCVTADDVKINVPVE